MKTADQEGLFRFSQTLLRTNSVTLFRVASAARWIRLICSGSGAASTYQSAPAARLWKWFALAVVLFSVISSCFV
jgi:hypothetical protein